MVPVKEDESVGIFTGRNFHFYRTGSWMWDMAVMLARYGLNVAKVDRLATGLMDKFVRIYQAQATDEPPAENLDQLLRLMCRNDTFHHLMARNGRDYLLKDCGLSEKVIDELVSAIVRAVYNQDVDEVSAFVAVASLVAVQSGLWQVSGGNNRVATRLLERAQVKLVVDTVTTVERLSDKERRRLHYVVRTASRGAGTFDAVVLAVPLQLAKIKWKGFSESFPTPSSGSYHQTFITFVRGSPRRTAVKLNPFGSSGEFPGSVLTPANSSIPFISLQRCSTSVSGQIVQGTPVWKIQSRRPLTTDELDHIFARRDRVVVKVFDAYPKYSTFKGLSHTSFVLDEKLFYTSAAEWATSAIEMSSIAGRNAAKLVVRELRNSSK